MTIQISYHKPKNAQNTSVTWRLSLGNPVRPAVPQFFNQVSRRWQSVADPVTNIGSAAAAKNPRERTSAAR